ncbi:ATP-binding protein [Streptomyces agglomeratus]|uniref:ATP-binding protein n=1 Tax=Streptomyces agglomeratus TaxID=285458 RepID=UPI001FD146EE|nr:ATP-binding protein [Streptomyces agglomeratus]
MTADRHDPETGLPTAFGVEQTWKFNGALSDVSDARDKVCAYLYRLARVHPPRTPDAHDDALLVVTELASNAFTFAPGPFTLSLRAMTTGTLHIAVADTSPAVPSPRPANLNGRGGLGWHLINALADQTITVPDAGGKTVHAFLPW